MHYLCLVVSKNRDIEDMLNKYLLDSDGEFVGVFNKKEAKKEFDAYRKEYGFTNYRDTDDFMKNFYKYHREGDQYGYEVYAAFDWYEIGGRWNLFLPVKESEVRRDYGEYYGTNQCRIKDLLYLPIIPATVVFNGRFIEKPFLGTGDPLPKKIKMSDFCNFLRNEMDNTWHTGSTNIFINYVRCLHKYYEKKGRYYIHNGLKIEADIIYKKFFALYDWKRNFRKKYIDSVPEDYWLTVVDYHV